MALRAFYRHLALPWLVHFTSLPRTGIRILVEVLAAEDPVSVLHGRPGSSMLSAKPKYIVNSWGLFPCFETHPYQIGTPIFSPKQSMYRARLVTVSNRNRITGLVEPIVSRVFSRFILGPRVSIHSLYNSSSVKVTGFVRVVLPLLKPATFAVGDVIVTPRVGTRDMSFIISGKVEVRHLIPPPPNELKHSIMD